MAFSDRDAEMYYAPYDPAYWPSDDDAAEAERLAAVREQQHLDSFCKCIRRYFRRTSDEDMQIYRDNIESILEFVESQIMED